MRLWLETLRDANHNLELLEEIEKGEAKPPDNDEEAPIFNISRTVYKSVVSLTWVEYEKAKLLKTLLRPRMKGKKQILNQKPEQSYLWSEMLFMMLDRRGFNQLFDAMNQACMSNKLELQHNMRLST